MKRRPVLLLLVIGVLVIYGFVNHKNQLQVLNDNYGRAILSQEQQLNSILILAKTMGQEKQWDELKRVLESTRKSSYFDFFYILQHQGRAIWSASDENNPAVLNINYQVLNSPVIKENESHETLTFGSDYKLTIGFFKNADAYSQKVVTELRDSLYQEAAYFTLIVFFVALWCFRDIFQIISKVKSGKTKEIGSIRTKSLESELFAKGFQTYAESVEALKGQNHSLESQVLPSLQEELLSGKIPPYDFHCTMVRTDINNFSKIYNTHDVSELMSLVNDFFTEVSHVVSRYHGFVHEFIGDEVIFYFKDEHHQNSFVTALSAVRDINEVAVHFNQKTLQKNGYAFTVKSSLAHGSLRFGPLVNGFSLAGSILIETVRILSQIIEKDGNVAYFNAQHKNLTDRFIESVPAVEVQMKGYTEVAKLERYVSHRDLKEVLAQLSKSTHLGSGVISSAAPLTYYRSDAHLKLILNYLRTHTHELDETRLLEATQVLREITMTKSDGQAAEELWLWLDTLDQNFQQNYDGRPSKVLSSALRLLANLIPAAQFDKKTEVKLLAFTSSPDLRVVANALDALSHFKVNSDIDFLRHLQESHSNRVTANALVAEGIQSISKPVLKRIKKLLFSHDVNFKASALYAYGEIMAFHQKRDPVYLETQFAFMDLMEEVIRLCEDKNEMVARQACAALAKTRRIPDQRAA